MKIYSDGKWILQNKEDVIDNIMNSNYIVLDDHYSEKAKNKLEKHKQKEIEKFMQALETEEMEVVKKIKNYSFILNKFYKNQLLIKKII